MSDTVLSTPETTLPPLRKRTLQSISSKPGLVRLRDFKIIEKLGQGTFGVVQKAKDKQNGDLVAIKQLLNHSAKEGFPITALREITILKQLHHVNVLSIAKIIFEEPKLNKPEEIINTRGCFYTVSHYMSSDLVGLLENPNVSLKLTHIKCIMEQLLTGINYIHQQRFLHRDIKAANILIDSEGVLKIADFGLARVYHGHTPELALGPGGGERNYTGLVVTRWYRPPELLLGERKYTTAVDMWGIGCVFAELFTRKPILVGKSDAHQAQIVFGLVGSPINWTHAATLPNKSDYAIGLNGARTLESRFDGIIPADGIRLLSGLLTLDPYKRFNALDALNHEFFRNEPLPLRPEELPKFEESHEIDKERFKKLRESVKAGNSVVTNFNNTSHQYVTPFADANYEGTKEQSTGANTAPTEPRLNYESEYKHDTYIPKGRTNYENGSRNNHATNDDGEYSRNSRVKDDGEYNRNPRSNESSFSNNHREYYSNYNNKPSTQLTKPANTLPVKPTLPAARPTQIEGKTPGSNQNSPTVDKFLKIDNGVGYGSNRGSPYLSSNEGNGLRNKAPKAKLSTKEANESKLVLKPVLLARATDNKKVKIMSPSNDGPIEGVKKTEVETDKKKPLERNAEAIIRRLHLKSPNPRTNDSGNQASTSKSEPFRSVLKGKQVTTTNVSSIFTNKERKRPVSVTLPSGTKKKARFEVNDGDESDLSESEDFSPKDAEILSAFLDHEGWRKEPEYRKVRFELVKYQKSKNQ